MKVRVFTSAPLSFPELEGRTMHCCWQMWVSVSPEGAELVQVYLTGQGLK